MGLDMAGGSVWRGVESRHRERRAGVNQPITARGQVFQGQNFKP